tara:strand:+ start:52 stop:1011 length:960 start_codon:yes stop_codon:yes gene_type:complete
MGEPLNRCCIEFSVADCKQEFQQILRAAIEYFDLKYWMRYAGSNLGISQILENHRSSWGMEHLQFGKKDQAHFVRVLYDCDERWPEDLQLMTDVWLPDCQKTFPELKVSGWAIADFDAWFVLRQGEVIRSGYAGINETHFSWDYVGLRLNWDLMVVDSTVKEPYLGDVCDNAPKASVAGSEAFVKHMEKCLVYGYGDLTEKVPLLSADSAVAMSIWGEAAPDITYSDCTTFSFITHEDSRDEAIAFILDFLSKNKKFCVSGEIGNESCWWFLESSGEEVVLTRQLDTQEFNAAKDKSTTESGGTPTIMEKTIFHKKMRN